MSKFPHETKGYNVEFHGWYNMEPPPLSGLLKANPTHRRVLEPQANEGRKKLVDLNGEANEVLYRANNQKTKADMSRKMITFLNFELFQKHRGHNESYERSQDGNAKIEEERNKGFEDSRQLAKGNEPRQP
ncbi:hypothetical protein C1H46_005984 [Malus baccata]|uniref:Uncharacterized protein n=1 Tax=Malus baccata TaxID=106549 RepID=A0A540NBD3_MALBA|nr:hypothetical protein C1H46_005984 [Malus baccata]